MSTALGQEKPDSNSSAEERLMSYQECPGDVGAVGLVADPERADDGAEVNVLLGIKNQELTHILEPTIVASSSSSI